MTSRFNVSEIDCSEQRPRAVINSSECDQNPHQCISKSNDHFSLSGGVVWGLSYLIIKKPDQIYESGFFLFLFAAVRVFNEMANALMLNQIQLTGIP